MLEGQAVKLSTECSTVLVLEIVLAAGLEVLTCVPLEPQRDEGNGEVAVVEVLIVTGEKGGGRVRANSGGKLGETRGGSKQLHLTAGNGAVPKESIYCMHCTVGALLELQIEAAKGCSGGGLGKERQAGHGDGCRWLRGWNWLVGWDCILVICGELG